MGAREALLDLLVEEAEWRRFFATCCHYSYHRLHSQAWQFANELTARGLRFERADVEDALALLTVELLPGSPAAGASQEWSAELAAEIREMAPCQGD